MSDIKWYNGPPDVPRFIYVYKHKLFGRFKDDCDTLVNVREHYDQLGLKYGIDYAFPKKFIVRLDYFPKSIDDLWVVKPSLYCGKNELGPINSLEFIEDGDGVEIKTGLLTVSFHLPAVEKRYKSILEGELMNEAIDKREKEENDVIESFRYRFG